MSHRQDSNSKRPKQPKPPGSAPENIIQEAIGPHPSHSDLGMETQLRTHGAGPALQQMSPMDRAHYATQPAYYAGAHLREDTNYRPRSHSRPPYPDPPVTYPWQVGVEAMHTQSQRLMGEVPPRLLDPIEQRTVSRSMVLTH